MSFSDCDDRHSIVMTVVHHPLSDIIKSFSLYFVFLDERYGPHIGRSSQFSPY